VTLDDASEFVFQGLTGITERRKSKL